MLNALRGSDQPGVFYFGRSIFVNQVFAFGDQPGHGFALLAPGAHAQQFKHLVQPLLLRLGFFQVEFQRLFQLGIIGLLHHLRHGRNGLFFGTVQILQLVLEQVFQVF
jgi:hypothetical protein